MTTKIFQKTQGLLTVAAVLSLSAMQAEAQVKLPAVDNDVYVATTGPTYSSTAVPVFHTIN